MIRRHKPSNPYGNRVAQLRCGCNVVAAIEAQQHRLIGDLAGIGEYPAQKLPGAALAVLALRSQSPGEALALVANVAGDRAVAVMALVSPRHALLAACTIVERVDIETGFSVGCKRTIKSRLAMAPHACPCTGVASPPKSAARSFRSRGHHLGAERPDSRSRVHRPALWHEPHTGGQCSRRHALHGRRRTNECRQKFIDFLKRLQHDAERPVFVIVDGHGSHHRARKILDFVRATDGRLRRFFLPPYSPELNADELIQAVYRHMRSLQKMPALTQAFFCERRVRYAMT